MSTKQNFLIKSVDITNSCLTAVFLLFLIDYFHAFLSFKIPELLASLIGLAMKIFVVSGLLGALIDVVLDRTVSLSRKEFFFHARHYWKMVAGVFLISVIGTTTLYFLPFGYFSEPVYLANSVQFLIFLVIGIMIYAKKFETKLSYLLSKIHLQPSQYMILLALYLVSLSFNTTPYFYIPSFWEELVSITTIIEKYVLLLAYIYFFTCLDDALGQPHKTDQKEVYLVYPIPRGPFQYLMYIAVNFFPPVFLVLRALTKQGYRFRIFLRLFWHKRYYAKDKLVAITCFTSNSQEGYKLAKGFKKAGSTVVMGGPHVSYLPEEALEYCDAVVVGDAEGVWERLIEDYEQGKLQKVYKGHSSEEQMDKVYDHLLESPISESQMYIETSRGCKFTCDFCTIPGLTSGKLVQRPVEKVIRLLKRIREEASGIILIDNNIYSDPAYTKKLFEAMIPLKMVWSTQVSLDIANNIELLKLAKRAGCVGLLCGYEISSASLESKQRGKFAMNKKFFEYSSNIKEMGIDIKAQFIIGFDSDTYMGILKLWWFCFKVNPRYTMLNCLTPLPGSQVYYDMIKENRILNLNWREYTCHTMVFRHPHINFYFLKYGFYYIFLLFFLTTSYGGRKIVGIVLLVFLFEAFCL